MGSSTSDLSGNVNEKLIKDEVNAYPVVMYTKMSCGYCTCAKDLLNKENIKFKEKDLDLISATNPDSYQQYVNGLVYITRQTSVPQIFICGKFIGAASMLIYEKKRYNYVDIGRKLIASVFGIVAVVGRVQDMKNGGWQIEGEKTVGIKGPCNIDRVDSKVLSQEMFEESYAFTKPVVIYNYNNNPVFQESCQKEVMLREWKHTPIVLNSANTYSYTRVDAIFNDYVQNILQPQDVQKPGNETLYLFGDIDQTIWKPLIDQYNQPKWMVPGHETALSFGIAGAGTGVPFHFHGPGFGEVIHGSKRWFLFPFEQRPEFDPDKSTLYWYLNVYPKLSDDKKPLECLLKPNELIYFPDKWWHATLNSETSVFISTFYSSFISAKQNADL